MSSKLAIRKKSLSFLPRMATKILLKMAGSSENGGVR